ncbi:MAG TPA: plastocyanin/azurin family copper-binding protein [Solirubrobacterales bacterium]|nr:plastocyanin/azurin family copper-binding protein [Solirubrobacterales bacterium]
MSNETLFFIFGIALAVSAVTFSFIGLKVKGFPGKAFPVVVLWFAILVGCATTFAVLHAKDEDKEKAAKYEQAGKEIEKAETSGPFESAAKRAEGKGGEEKAETGGEAAKGPGGTLEIASVDDELKFDVTELESKPGKVTIDFKNGSGIPHNVQIESEAGEVLGGTETVSESEAEATVELPPGNYKFFCSIPGHRQAGMEGTLVVK